MGGGLWGADRGDPRVRAAVSACGGRKRFAPLRPPPPHPRPRRANAGPPRSPAPGDAAPWTPKADSRQRRHAIAACPSALRAGVAFPAPRPLPGTASVGPLVSRLPLRFFAPSFRVIRPVSRHSRSKRPPARRGRRAGRATPRQRCMACTPRRLAASPSTARAWGVGAGRRARPHTPTHVVPAPTAAHPQSPRRSGPCGAGTARGAGHRRGRRCRVRGPGSPACRTCPRRGPVRSPGAAG